MSKKQTETVRGKTATPLRKLYVVIPVYNESANIDRLSRALKDLKEHLDHEFEIHYLIVNDGSNDDTVMQFQNNDLGDSLIILSHKVNQGPGAAFGTAFDYLVGRLADEDFVLTMEGDNTSQFELLRAMLAKARDGAEMVLASPYAPGGKMFHVAFHRLFLSHVATILSQYILGLRGIHTLSSFYRIYKGSLIKRLQARYGEKIIESSGFECAVEALMKSTRLGAKIIEVPMILDFSARKGRSKMRIIRTIKGYFRLFVKMRFGA